MIDDLKLVSAKLIKAKEELDEVEREYVKLKSQLILSTLKLYTNAEAREAAITLQLENDVPEFLNKLYDLRGDVRKLQIERENLILEIKFSWKEVNIDGSV